MAAIPNHTPATLEAGVSVEWTRSLDDYPASSGWVLSYVFVKQGTQLTIEAAAEGDTHRVSVSATDSRAWDPGTYDYKAYIALDPQRHCIESGQIEIWPDFAQQSVGMDGRSHAARMLAAIEAVLEKKATKDQLSYSIGGRSITRLAPQELIDWRAYYKRELGRERKRLGRVRRSGCIKMRFSR